MGTSLIITAAGAGSRFGDENKCLVLIDEKPVLLRLLDIFLQFEWEDIVVTASEESIEAYRKLLQSYSNSIRVILGGNTRFDSVRRAVAICSEASSTVLVHDGARPFVSKDLIQRLLGVDTVYKAVVPGIPVVDTIKRVDDANIVLETPARRTLRAIQTPQRFHLPTLKCCYANKSKEEITDEAMLMELNGEKVLVIDGDIDNFKLTYQSDLK